MVRENEKEDEPKYATLDQHPEKERDTTYDTAPEKMVLRSHTRAMMENVRDAGYMPTQQNAGTDRSNPGMTAPKAYVSRQPVSGISDRDFQEYMPSRQPFYNDKVAVPEGEYPYETFTHESFCTMACANRLSVRRALEQEDGRKKEASKEAIKAEIKQLMEVGAFKPVHLNAMNEEVRKKIIPSHMFLKEKL